MIARLDDTNTHTFFLREPEALDAVVRHVPNGGSVWSAGCSTGEEVYSLLLLARESGVDLHVVGTDINRAALKVARRGRYPARRLRYVDSLRRAAFFDRIANDTFEVKPDVRSTLLFTHHNLAADAALTTGGGRQAWDAILCRNVFLYLTAEHIDFALANFARALKPGGVLFFGASELMSSALHSHRPRRHGLLLTDLGGAWGYCRRDPASPSFSINNAHQRVRTPAAPLQTPPAPAQKPPPPTQSADVVSALRLQGDRFLDAGDPHAAQEIYQRAVERDGLAPDLHLRLAVCRLQLGAPQEAKEALRRSLFLEPELWPAAMLLGDLVEAEEPIAAARYFEQARDALAGNGNLGGELSGALAPFVAGRRAAAEALDCRLRLLRRGDHALPSQEGSSP